MALENYRVEYRLLKAELDGRTLGLAYSYEGRTHIFAPVLRFEEERNVSVYRLIKEHIPNLIFNAKWSHRIFHKDLQEGETFNPRAAIKMAEKLEEKLDKAPLSQ